MRLSGSESAGIWVGNQLAARVQLTPEDPVLTYTDDWKASGFTLSPALPLTGPGASSHRARRLPRRHCLF